MKTLTIELLLSVFRGREDVIAVDHDGVKSKRCVGGEYRQALEDHISGVRRAAIYNHLPGDVVFFAVMDFDCHGTSAKAQIDLMANVSAKTQEFLISEGVPCYREISKSGPGNFHLWIFFERAVSSVRVRAALAGVKAQIEATSERDFAVEIFPKQETLNGGIGNCIYLPSFPPDVENGKTIFVDVGGAPLEEEFQFATVEHFESLADRLERQGSVRNSSVSRTDDASLLSTDPSEGERHNTLVKILGGMKGHRLPFDDARAIAENWNDALTSPLPAAEVQSTVRSIYRDADGRGFKFALRRGSEMTAMEIPEAPDLVEGIFRAKSLNFLAGEEGSGKSILAMNLGLAVATGAEKFLTWDIAASGPVLFLNNELYFEDFVRRFRQMTRLVTGPGGLDEFVAPERVPALGECWETLNDTCAKIRPVLVIVDCLYFAHNQDESDNSKMRDLMRRLQEIRDAHDTCILAVHHLKKGGREQRLNSEQMRGAGAFASAADSIVMIRRSQTAESSRILKPTKLRHSGDENKQARLLSLNGDSLWFCDEGTANEDDHIDHGGQAVAEIDFEDFMSGGGDMSLKDVLAAVPDASPATVRRRLSESVRRGEICKIRRGKYKWVGRSNDHAPKGGEHLSVRIRD